MMISTSLDGDVLETIVLLGKPLKQHSLCFPFEPLNPTFTFNRGWGLLGLISGGNNWMWHSLVNLGQYKEVPNPRVMTVVIKTSI